MNTPVLIIIYNRPKITKKLLGALNKQKPKKLYVFCDGAKNSSDQELVLESRNLVENIGWDCKVTTKYQKSNLGCKKGVELAIDWFFNKENFGIILEDDCIPNKSFFTFTEELLKRYKNDSRVSIITGFNAGNKIKNYDYDYYFSTYGGVWGWASWAKNWQEYRSTNIESLVEDNELISSLKSKGVSSAFINYAKKSLDGSLDTWDYLWTFYNMSQNKLSIVPQKNFITNIGFGLDATHTKIASDLSKISHEKISSKIKHPKYILPSKNIDNKRRLNHNKIYQAYRAIKSILIN